MDEIDNILWLMIVVVVGGFLCEAAISELQLRAGERRRRKSETPSHGIDVSALTPKIQRVRQDYVATLHSSPRPASHKTGLVAASRRIIASLAFFQAGDAEREKPLDEV